MLNFCCRPEADVPKHRSRRFPHCLDIAYMSSTYDSRWCCLDCGKNTGPAEEYFMLRHELWRRLVGRRDRGGMLCIRCVELRLGRGLCGRDFLQVPVNAGQARVCDALAQRLAAVVPAKLKANAGEKIAKSRANRSRANRVRFRK
jgi:hypothetical protein